MPLNDEQKNRLITILETLAKPVAEGLQQIMDELREERHNPPEPSKKR